MSITVVCKACGGRRTVPDELYEQRIRGRVVSIACKACGARILVDGTLPPPPDSDPDPMAVVEVSVPPPARVPFESSFPRHADHTGLPLSSEDGPTGRVGRYALFEQFATGGMATVHLGRLDGAGGFARVVAIKRLLPHLLENREFTQMLLKEARLAARVRHPNVVATLDVVATKGDVLLVLDYVHGEALSTLCRTQAKERGTFVPVPVAIGIMADVLQGLCAIHEATDERGRVLSLVHRDVSPPNVLVGSDGVARILDFGIATALEQIEDTASGRRKGKRGYMSPEQIRGERLTQRSDVFSAGIVLWELLALRRMFPTDQTLEPAEAVLLGSFKPVSIFRPEISPELDAIVMRALEAEPDARYATIREFGEALEAAEPRSNARRIGEWVNDLAREALGERTRMVARAENWASGVELPLSSSPFSSEFPQTPDSTVLFESEPPMALREGAPPPPLGSVLIESEPPPPPLGTLVADRPVAFASFAKTRKSNTSLLPSDFEDVLQGSALGSATASASFAPPEASLVGPAAPTRGRVGWVIVALLLALAAFFAFRR